MQRVALRDPRSAQKLEGTVIRLRLLPPKLLMLIHFE